jgi:hypothetical protein
MAVAMAVGAGAGAADVPAPARVEARSSDLLAVGVVHGESMSVHVSRISDNAPVRDAVVTVILRGISHPVTAEADGSYSLQSKDLTLPGAANVDFHIVQGTLQQDLKGILDISPSGGEHEDKNSARQLWWWVLNFTVCGVAFYLFSRRKSAKS